MGATVWTDTEGPMAGKVIHFEIPIDDGQRAVSFYERMPIPTVGWSAFFLDTEGNRVGLFQTDPNASMPEGEMAEPPTC